MRVRGSYAEGYKEQNMKTIVMGILAHVDAGKTTLSEAMLYESGVIRSIGRVDKGNTYLERDNQERERGITIFSKQAVLPVHEDKLILLDTPGHVDFSAEAERTLQVLDLAVLVVSAADGVQGHTMTLWKLLSRYHIPVFLFVNKLDQPGTDADAVYKELQERLSGECVNFRLPHGDAFMESVAMCGEEAMEQYLQTGEVSRESIARLIRERKLFPCFFGAALKMEGVKELLEGIDTYGEPAAYHTEFGARVYKITRDPQGNRLTHMKITGGQLPVKTVITGKNRQQEEWQEKVNQIRCYNGEKFELADCVQAGTICTVTGLSQTYIGQGLGVETEQTHPLLEPVMSYRVLPEQENQKVIETKGLKIDVDSRRVYIDDKEVNLTAKEFELVYLLVSNPNKVYSREQLLKTIWGPSYPGDARTVDVHVRRLREKIEATPADPKYIHTKWGVGYYFHE